MDVSFEAKMDPKNIKEHQRTSKNIHSSLVASTKMVQAPLWTGNMCSHAFRPEGAWVGEIHVRIPSLRDRSEHLSPRAAISAHLRQFCHQIDTPKGMAWLPRISHFMMHSQDSWVGRRPNNPHQRSKRRSSFHSSLIKHFTMSHLQKMGVHCLGRWNQHHRCPFPIGRLIHKDNKGVCLSL